MIQADVLPQDRKLAAGFIFRSDGVMRRWQRRKR
jgi:hypothetical protein